MLRVLGDIHASGAAAEASYRQAINMAAELGLRPVVARCRLHLGLMHGSCGPARPSARAARAGARIAR